MSPSPSVIEVVSAHAADFRARFGARKFGVFGSCARGGRCQDKFESLLGDRLGRPVDLGLESAIEPALRDSILRDVRHVA